MSSNLPAVASEGAGNGYTALNARLKKLQATADALMEEAERVAHRMKRNATFAADVADMSAAAAVAPHHVTAIEEVSAAFAQAQRGHQRLAGAADTVSQAAGHLMSTHRTQYGGIHAANQVTSRRVRQAKAGFSRRT